MHIVVVLLADDIRMPLKQHRSRFFAPRRSGLFDHDVVHLIPIAEQPMLLCERLQIIGNAFFIAGSPGNRANLFKIAEHPSGFQSLCYNIHLAHLLFTLSARAFVPTSMIHETARLFNRFFLQPTIYSSNTRTLIRYCFSSPGAMVLRLPFSLASAMPLMVALQGSSPVTKVPLASIFHCTK